MTGDKGKLRVIAYEMSIGNYNVDLGKDDF